MKTLEKEFVKCNFAHKQIHREGNLAIFERHHINSDKIHFEVVKIREQKACLLSNGVQLENKEIYPSDNLGGALGFTCLTKERAFERLEAMKDEKLELEG